MEMLLYLVLAVVLYGFLADQADRMVEREMRKRRQQGPELRLVVFPAPSVDPTDEQRDRPGTVTGAALLRSTSTSTNG